jgi:hypothetical protein
MESAETRLANVMVIRSEESDITERIRNASVKYGLEGVEGYKALLETPDGAEYPPAAPIV